MCFFLPLPGLHHTHDGDLASLSILALKSGLRLDKITVGMTITAATISGVEMFTRYQHQMSSGGSGKLWW